MDRLLKNCPKGGPGRAGWIRICLNKIDGQEHIHVWFALRSRYWHPFEDKHLYRFGRSAWSVFSWWSIYPFLDFCSPILRAIGNVSWVWLSLGCFGSRIKIEILCAKVLLFWYTHLVWVYIRYQPACQMMSTLCVRKKNQTNGRSRCQSDLLHAPQVNISVAHVGAVMLEELEACGFNDHLIQSNWNFRPRKSSDMNRISEHHPGVECIWLTMSSSSVFRIKLS